MKLLWYLYLKRKTHRKKRSKIEIQIQKQHNAVAFCFADSSNEIQSPNDAKTFLFLKSLNNTTKNKNTNYLQIVQSR